LYIQNQKDCLIYDAKIHNFAISTLQIRWFLFLEDELLYYLTLKMISLRNSIHFA